jgi:gluconokinase
MIVVLMGVSGCGKTKVGRALAADLRWPFFDADDFHPEANVAKMAAGTPLTDADRWPWLDRVAAEMGTVLACGGNAVLACSALRQVYRDRLASCARAPGDMRFVYPRAITRRSSRGSPTEPPLHAGRPLASQFATLEEPKDAIVIDVATPIPEKIAQIRAALRLEAAA